ncbi:hypothetical protein XBFFL1_1600051 [Xenorhabdus bovienii str. feltiae Florida]|nr:hypothetical protein XBFFR1_1250012 [Xenorhabdus bovienii str. feltiae France]CDG91458.1 hypothetical protein XBFFL1_1600051 [Xenorhabdus bovienii str. feltiae Florida]
MNFLKPGGYIATNQLIGVYHGLCGGLGLPAVWAEVIAAENQLVEGEMMFIRQLLDKAAEVCGRHASIAAILINLVGGGFDKQGGVGFPGVAHGGFQH